MLFEPLYVFIVLVKFGYLEKAAHPAYDMFSMFF